MHKQFTQQGHQGRRDKRTGETDLGEVFESPAKIVLWPLRPCCELLVLRGLRDFVVNFLVVVMDLGYEPGRI